MAAAYRPRAEQGLVVPPGVLDQLSLLQLIRQRAPGPGKVLELQVTNGKKNLDYRVTTEAGEALVIGGQLRDCWRLRVEGFKQGHDDGEPVPEHAPILVWLSADAQRVPVRFYSDHGLGAFSVDWIPAGQAPAVKVAISAQPFQVDPPLSPFPEEN
jgi:hypothetical protein